MKIEYEKMLRQDAFQRAMIEAQKEMEPVVRRAQNKQTDSKYAKLEQISAIIRPIYQKHGFTPTFNSRVDDRGQKWVTCWLLHDGGHKEYYELPGEIEDAGMKGIKNKTWLQGLGVMVSYLRRYLLCMIFDVILIDEDPDGNREKEEPKEDAFAARAKEESPQWDGKGLMVDGKMKKFAGGAEVTPDAGAGALKQVLQGIASKDDRVKTINDNLPLVRAIMAAGKESVVTDLHALADKGA
jgi:hypothetical protein